MSPIIAVIAVLCFAATSEAAKLAARAERDAPSPKYRPSPQAYEIPLKDLDGDGYANEKLELEPDALLPINYQFSYNVEDGEIGNYQTRSEVRDGLETFGEYSYIDPNGVLRTVKYTSHPVNGYEAKEYEQQTQIIPKPPKKHEKDAYGRHVKPQEQYNKPPQEQYNKPPQYRA
ncbi:unnamed protein product [Notodromas monacha]|uniref:Uncharacterized protein n=1 Tax=Notodromas monacha TaxID=399045 RepID=A0A7R9BTQ8_9CRUS|nr:unnamed protein product [Notodromas monacha]CAG0920540.1 unnamed protein product [Notodromas monacha]